MNAPKVVIKKYENRRLYDSTNSRYVNLEEVAAMIRQGTDVEVTDAKTGEDLTRLILTQIIVEDAKGRDSALPLDVLRQMIVASGRAGQESFAQYMRAVNEMYRNSYRMFPPAMTPFDFIRSVFPGGNPAAGVASEPQAPAPEATPPGTPPEAPRPNLHPEEMMELKQRVEELERRLAKRSGEARKSVRPRLRS